MYPEGHSKYIEILLDKSPLMVYVVELKPPEINRIIYYNPAFERYLGWKREDVKSPRWWIENVHPEDRERVLSNLQRLIKEGEISHYYRFRKKDGSYIWIYSHAILVERKNSVIVVSGYWVDITPLQETRELYRIILERSPVLVFLTDDRILYVNETVRHLMGYSLEELKRKTLWDLVHEDYREEVKRIVQNLTTCKKAPKHKVNLEVPLICKDGKRRVLKFTFYSFLKEGKCYALAIGIDISPQKELERKFIHSVLRDTLTGLPNRIFFIEHTKNFIRLATRKGEYVALLVLDIDDFSKINATYGTRFGDEVLKRVAQLIRKSLEGRGLVARFFADEFGVVFLVKDFHELNYFLEKILSGFSEAININGNLIFINVRVGIALAPRDGTEPEDLINKAEIALKVAQTEKKRFSYFSKEIEVEILEKIHIKNKLIKAIENEEFILHYQPIVDLQKVKPVGIEALVRWITEEGKVITPDKFIPVAEELELIIPLGNLILKKALKDFSELLKEGYELFLSVNFSAKQFINENLPETIRKTLEKFCVPPSKFLIEITESTAMENPELTKEIISKLKRVGVMIGIDDFGTGYSSMNYLLQFDIDRLKLDKIFTERIHADEKVKKVAHTIISLAHNLGAKALAEGIEEEEQLRVLRQLGCDEGQGYLFAKPMSFGDLVKWLKNG
ncbi:sensor domain-containing protein [Aquifex sp.]